MAKNGNELNDKKMRKTFILFTIVLFSMLAGRQAKAQIVLQRCDTKINWESSNTLAIDNSNVKEGSGSLSFTGSGTDWFMKVFSQTNVGVDISGYFTFWLYVSDISAFDGDGQIEISSSGVADNNEYNWPVSSAALSNGWNHVKLAINEAGVVGTPSLDAINYFRIYQPLSAEITAKIDFIRFTATETMVESDKLLDINEVDKTTLDGKLMFGYQGWFGAVGDGSQRDKFNHWGPLGTGSGGQSELSVDMWFDDSEYGLDEIYKTGYYYPDGRNAGAFSSYNKKTVNRHMKWLRDYGLDGVFLQRFLTDVQDPVSKEFRDKVLVNVMEGCERYGRAFVMMYDGLDFANSTEKLKEDWKHLIDDLKMTESSAYLHHRGRPLVSLWGYAYDKQYMTTEQLEDLIDFFHNNPEEKYRATIKIGCNHKWIELAGWKEVLKDVDVISPWSVGRYNDKSSYVSHANTYVSSALEWCDNNNVDFMPVSWPGFSWYNLHDGPKNQIPRRGGQYFWEQINGNLARGAKSLYIAMFDEVDEATAMFKLAENAQQSPDKGYWLDLDDDGTALPSDWYLRCATLATKTLQGKIDNVPTLATPPEGLDVIALKVAHESCDMDNGILEIGYPGTSTNPVMEFSIDGGENYAYTTPLESEVITINDLSAGTYNVWVRYEDDSFPTDLGDISIFDTVPPIRIMVHDNSLEVTVDERHYLRPLEFSLDDGTNYSYNLTDTEHRLVIDNYTAPDEFHVYYRIKDTGCQRNVLYEPPPVSTPYAEHYIPGTINIENYDIGGEGVAYHETDNAHTGNANFRKDESVDIGIVTDEEGGYFMGWNDTGEWVKYTVNNIVSGIYDMEFKVASPSDGRSIDIYFNDEFVKSLSVPNTGGWHTWEKVRLKNIVVDDVEQIVIKLVHTNGLNIGYFSFLEPVRPEKATAPIPEDGATDVDVSQILRWTAGANTASHDIYFGTTNPPEFITNFLFTMFTETLEPNTTYYWRIDEVNGPLVTEGDVWSFTTIDNTSDINNGLKNNAAFTIFPNPGDGHIQIWLNLMQETVTIQIFDMQGKCILQQDSNKQAIELNLSEYGKGVYLVRVLSDNKTAVSQKIIIE